jgi:hypothetical protein
MSDEWRILEKRDILVNRIRDRERNRRSICDLVVYTSVGPHTTYSKALNIDSLNKHWISLDECITQTKQLLKMLFADQTKRISDLLQAFDRKTSQAFCSRNYCECLLVRYANNTHIFKYFFVGNIEKVKPQAFTQMCGTCYQSLPIRSTISANSQHYYHFPTIASTPRPHI